MFELWLLFNTNFFRLVLCPAIIWSNLKPDMMNYFTIFFYLATFPFWGLSKKETYLRGRVAVGPKLWTYYEPFYTPFYKYYNIKAGPIAERTKSSDLDCGWGDPGSNPGEGRNFFYFLSRW